MARTAGESGTVRATLGRVFSVRAFLAALVATGAGAFLGSGVPLLGGVGAVVGVALAGFLLGLLSEAHYVETALAGGLVGGAAVVLNYLVVTLVAGPWLPVVGGVAGVLAGAIGHYFGRDLRNGFTRELD